MRVPRTFLRQVRRNGAEGMPSGDTFTILSIARRGQTSLLYSSERRSCFIPLPSPARKASRPLVSGSVSCQESTHLPPPPHPLLEPLLSSAYVNPAAPISHRSRARLPPCRQPPSCHCLLGGCLPLGSNHQIPAAVGQLLPIPMYRGAR